MTTEDDDDLPFPGLFDDPKAVEIDEWFNKELKIEDPEYVEGVWSTPWLDEKADKTSRLDQIILAIEVIGSQDPKTFNKARLDKLRFLAVCLHSISEELV